MASGVAERWQWLGSMVNDGPKQIDGSLARRAKSLAAASPPTSNKAWGRAADRRGWKSSMFSLVMMVMPPLLMTFTWIALEYFQGSLWHAFVELQEIGLCQFADKFAPGPSLKAAAIYICWSLFQVALYAILPGRGRGQLTPAGELLEYNVNGMQAWAISVALAVGGFASGLIDPAIVTDNWGGLLVVMNIWGWIFSIIAFFKAYLAPTHPADRKFSGSMLYDFYMGIELNPRFSRSSTLDWKLFHNGRPGIIGWTLIDLAWTWEQYRRHGYVTSSMLVVDILHAAYVIDFFFNEDWYLRTIDICHDHFGFYLAWGSAVWLPTMYTLQAQYLARQPVELHPAVAIAIAVAGLSGYVIFRSVNDQKNRVRLEDGKCLVWGRPAEVLRVRYQTSDGVERQSLLLCSGWWGLARHANYMGDLLLSFAMCAPCGLTHLLPWTYGIFMTMILLHRCHRDEQRLKAKYGEQWDQYCSKVPYRIVPGIF